MRAPPVPAPAVECTPAWPSGSVVLLFGRHVTMARESWSTVGGQRTNKAREVLWVLSPPGAARARVCASGKGLSLYQFTLPGMKNIWFETILAEVEYDEDVWRDDASLTVGDADGELTYAMARDLCEKLLRRDPRKRITARQALKHPFLRRQSEKV